MKVSTMRNLYEIVRERAERYPDDIAFGGSHGVGWRTVTSAELLVLVDRLAGELADTLAIAAGDRVVLWLPNSWQAPIYHFALWKLGAVVVPFDRDMNAGAARAILAAVEPRCAIVGYGDRPEWLTEETAVADWWEPGARGGTARDEVASEELAVLAFTSGTTGNPKGCMITHRNLLHEVDTLGERIPLAPGCRLASVLPLSHLFELTCGMLYPLAAGATVHYVPSRRGPDILAVFQQQRISHLIAVPQLLTLMGKAIDDQLRQRLSPRLYDGLVTVAERAPFPARRHLFFMVHQKLGGHLQMIASGGAALPPATQRQWERFGVRIVQGYGTSECAPVIAAGAPDGSTPVGSVGRLIRGDEIRLTAEGELEVHGPNVMRGYWRDPERTAQVLHDGWYATGDLGRVDENGNLWILGRARDLIVLPSGMNVWPEDVESVLRTHPAVTDAAIVAVPNEASGAVLHAYLIGSGTAADEREIIAWANSRLAAHQRLASASWWQSESGDFPRTSTLKVRRHLLPMPSAATLAAPPPIVGDPVARAIARVTRQATVRGDQTLGELGFDSLTLLELQVQLEEEVGGKLGEVLFRSDLTVELAPESGRRARRYRGGEHARRRNRQLARGRAALALHLGSNLPGAGLSPRCPPRLRGDSGGDPRQRPPAPASARGDPGRNPPQLPGPPAPALGTRQGRADRPAKPPDHRDSFDALRQRWRAGRGGHPDLRAVSDPAAAPAASQPERARKPRPRRQRGADLSPGAPHRPGARTRGRFYRELPPRRRPPGDRARRVDRSLWYRRLGEAHASPAAADFRGIVLPGGIPIQIHRAPAAIAFGAPLTPEAGESASAFTTRVQRVLLRPLPPGGSRLGEQGRSVAIPGERPSARASSAL